MHSATLTTVMMRGVPSEERLSRSGRVEAFSDGVFAIAITLLVLDLREPAEGSGSFVTDLAAQWPAYLAYVAAFAVLGLVWLSHHDLFSRITGATASLLLRNLLLLFTASLFSFPTAVLAASFREGATRDDQILAVGIYGIASIALTLAWLSLARILLRMPHLTDDSGEAVRYIHGQTQFAGIACAFSGLAFAAAFIAPIASIAVAAGLPLISLGFYRRAQHQNTTPSPGPASHP